MIIEAVLNRLDLKNGILRAWWIDPLTATVGFFIAIVYYSYQEINHNVASFQSMKDFFVAPIVDTKNDWNFMSASFISYWIGIFIWRIIVPPVADHIPDGIPNSIPSMLYLNLEVITGVLLYDAIFFFIHWGAHECKYLKFINHKEHHLARKNLEARYVLCHSLPDGILQVLVNIFVQRRNPWGAIKSRSARALHNLLVTWMLTESHTASPYPNIFRKYFVGVHDHRLHHIGGGFVCKGGSTKKHGHQSHRYQQFFGYLDDFKNKYWY